MRTFRRNPGQFMKLLKKKQAVVLNVKGKAEAVLQDAKSYQRLLNIAARSNARGGIRQGLEQAKKS